MRRREPLAEVLGVEHIDLCVRDLARSVRFYDRVLSMLGFSRVDHESYVAWSNGLLVLGLREASEAHRDEPADRTRSGLHHLAFKAATRGDIDRFHRFLQEEGLSVLDPPAEYPQYGPDYYAVFFEDPDGMKLELVHFAWGYWRRVQSTGEDPRPRRRRPA